MPRIAHGETVSVARFQAAGQELAARSSDVNLAFAAAVPADPTRFDFLFPELQSDPASLLPEDPSTVAALVELGRAMRDTGSSNESNSIIPAAYTYFGQFIDHDITLEAASAPLATLLDPALRPMSVEEIGEKLVNLRSATLDLDSVYSFPAPRIGPRLQIGNVTSLGGTALPLTRPAGKTDDNDLPRDQPSPDPRLDRAALVGDPRNDENTIVAQLHLAFLKAHNKLVDQGRTFSQARRVLRQHYQHLVLYDFLPKIVDPYVLDKLKNGAKFYDGLAEPFFMPLEFAVAAYRFGHTMVRAAYDFNVNFNTRGGGAVPATLDLLFLFTALQGQFTPGGGSGPQPASLPDNWIIQWEEFFPAGNNLARRFDTHLVEPLFELRDFQGSVEAGDGARLAVRNLLRGYLLRMPTGQAVAKKLGVQPMSVTELEAAAEDEKQVSILRDSGLGIRTPLWYYVLAEARHHGKGEHLGPVGSTLVAETLIGLVRRSEDSIVRMKKWAPTLGSDGKFELPDLLRFAGVLT